MRVPRRDGSGFRLGGRNDNTTIRAVRVAIQIRIQHFNLLSQGYVLWYAIAFEK